MLNHVVVGSNDIERSRRFYDPVLAVLGAPAAVSNDAASGHTRLFYRHGGTTFCVSEPINDEPATPAKWRHGGVSVRLAGTGAGLPRCGGGERRLVD